MRNKPLITALAVSTLSIVSIAWASEQKVIFELESTKSRGVSRHTCDSECTIIPKIGRFPKASELLKDGWRIISSSPKEVIQVDYTTVADLTTGCTCVGTQYVMQKDDPPKSDVPSKEVELLKKETELLKQEIAVLKQENENLKAQIKPKHKKK